MNLVDAMGMHPVEAFRYASFQVGSLSTTGFVSADFDQWPAFSKGVLMMLMISGGCAGSTASGVKVSRVVLLAKNAWAVVHQKLSPRRVIRAHMNGIEVGGDILMRVGQFFFLYIFAIVFWALLLTFDGIGAFDALGISVTTLGNVGPAFGIAGATCTFAGLSDSPSAPYKPIACPEDFLLHHAVTAFAETVRWWLCGEERHSAYTPEEVAGFYLSVMPG